MTTKEAEVFHKLRVATPLSTRGGQPVSVVFNGISANAWLSPIGISHGKQQKDTLDERFIAQRPHTAGSIAVVRHHPKPSGLQRSEILTGRQLPVNSNKSTCYHDDQAEFRRPMAFEDDYTSPIGSHMFNQKVIKKGYRGGGFCDGPHRRQRPHTSIPQMRITKETPITLELTVKSLELNRGSSEKGSCHVLYDDDRSQHQLLNVNAYEDLRKSCIQRAKSAPVGSRPARGSKSPSLYWRARSAYHRKLMTPTPDPKADEGEDTQVVRGSILRPLMYSSVTDIQHSAGCPYKCKGCFKACLVSQDYLEKSKSRRLPVRVRRDLRQRSMMKKDPRYILHQALARNQPIYKLVHGLCDERTVRKAWDDGGTIRGRGEDSVFPSDECSLVGESDVSVTVGETKVFQRETKSRELSSENTGSVAEVSEAVIETHKDQRQNTIAIDKISNLLNNRKIVIGTDRRVKSAEHRKLERPVDLKDRPKSCSPGQGKETQTKPLKSEFPKGFTPGKANVFISGEKRELKRGNALDLTDSETDRRREDSADDGRGSISTLTPVVPSTVGGSSETESVLPSEHNKCLKSRKGRKGKKLKKARKQEDSSEEESCSGSEEERSAGSDNTLENKRNRRKSKREDRRDKKYPDDGSNSGTSDTLTELSASGLSETSENGGYSSSETDCIDVNSNVDNETTDSDESELISPKEETKKRKKKETRKSMTRSQEYRHAASDDKTAEELIDGTRTPRTLDCAASEIQSGTESELQFDTASRDSGSVKGSVRSSSSNSGRCTTSCSSVKDSVTVKSERTSTKVSSCSSVRSLDKSIRRSDLSRGTSEPPSDRTVDNNSSDKDSLYSNPTSSINASSCSKEKNFDRLGRSKSKKSGRSPAKPTRQQSRFRSDSSSDDAESEEDSSEEESSDSSTQSGSSDEECVSQKISKTKEVKKSKIGRNMKVIPARSKKKGTFEKVNVERNSSDKSKVVVEAKTMDGEDAYEMENDCFDDIKSENIPINLSDYNHETKRKLYKRKKTKHNSRMESKVKERKIKSKNKCDDYDDDSDDKSSCDETSDEEEGGGDNNGKPESHDDDNGKTESDDDNIGKTESDDDKGEPESNDDDKGKTESDDDDKGEPESDDDDKGKTESDDDDKGKTESEDDDKRTTESDENDNVKRVAESKNGNPSIGKFQDINKSKTKTPKQKIRKVKKCSKPKHKNSKPLKGNKHRKGKGSDSESCSGDDADTVCSDSDDTNKEVSEASGGDTDSGCRERNKTKSKHSMDKCENKLEYSSEQMSDKEECDDTDSDGSVSDKNKDSDSSGETESSSDSEEESDDSDDDDSD